VPIILIFSIIIQLIAACIAVFQIKKSPGMAWVFIVIALFFMAIRRALSLFGFSLSTTTPETVGLIISVLMLLGVFFIPDLFKEHEQNIVRLKALQDIDRAMLSSLSHTGVMSEVTEKIIHTTDPDAIGIFTINKDGRQTNVLKSYNLSDKFLDRITSDDNNELIKSVIENKKPLIINRISKHDNFGAVALLREEGFSGYLSVPIITKGSIPIGALALYSKSPLKYTKKDINFINSISHQIGIALDRGQFIERIREMNFESVLALVQAIEIRDPYTRGHSLQVANLSEVIARAMEFTEREIEHIKFAGLLHDVGKIAVPESILKKPASLTDQEWQVIKMHPEQSVAIVKPIKGLRHIQSWILHHHERWDGAGYPKRIKAKKIPLPSRILAVCDTYSAMIGDRPYRKGLTDKEAKKEIKKVAGAQLDPHVVEIFLELYNQGAFESKDFRRDQGT
jgi:HD-GYP domain-containing protein (c-di-GMP phosphodiesterase class II)